MNFRSFLAACAAASLLALTGCATNHVYLTDGSSAAKADADRYQRAADAYRRAGNLEAGKKSQQMADEAYKRAQKKPDGFLAWLVDAAFESWLNSGLKSR